VPRSIKERTLPVAACQIPTWARLSFILTRLVEFSRLANDTLPPHGINYYPFFKALMANIDAFLRSDLPQNVNNFFKLSERLGLCNEERQFVGRCAKKKMIRKNLKYVVKLAKQDSNFLDLVRQHLMNVTGQWLFMTPGEIDLVLGCREKMVFAAKNYIFPVLNSDVPPPFELICTCETCINLF
jgi:hypothetical protein